MLFHFVIFTDGKSEFSYLLRLLSYRPIFRHPFLAKIAIICHNMTPLGKNEACNVNYAGDSSPETHALPLYQI